MSFQGYEIRFPVIKVKDKSSGHIHIVGSDSHDVLYIPPNSRDIHYYNMQNSDGTFDGYEFVTKKIYDETRIEFITFDELLEIYKSEMQMSIEREKVIKQIAEAFREEKRIAEEEGYRHT